MPLVKSISDRQMTVLDPGQQRKSYSVQALSRVQTVLRVIKQTEASATDVRAKIENKLGQAWIHQKKICAVEQSKMGVKLLQEDLEWRSKKLQQEKVKYEMLQTKNIQRERSQKQRLDTLRKDQARLHEKKKTYFDVREDLIKKGAQLVMRRKQLISELVFIYPISELPNGIYTIAGADLPNSEQFQGYSDIQLEVGLGYTCHLVQMISYLLDMPLRYPVEHRGSKSIITDHILDKLVDKEREFPVYSKGKEKFQFDYGVYLLNKNIAQLRYYCGLGTTDLRLTLPNLKTLLHLRLGVRFDHPDSEVKCLEPSIYRKELTVESSSKPTTLSVASSSEESANFKRKNHYEASVNQNGDETPLASENSRKREATVRKDELLKGSQDSFFTFQEKTSSYSSPERLKHSINCNIEHVDDVFETPLSNEDNPFKEITKREERDKNEYRRNILEPSSMQTLDNLTKEKLVGPISSYQDIDVSSSEDSASAIYRSKLWPNDMDTLDQINHPSGTCDVDTDATDLDATLKCVYNRQSSSQSVTSESLTLLGESEDQSNTDEIDTPTFITHNVNKDSSTGVINGSFRRDDKRHSSTEENECLL